MMLKFKKAIIKDMDLYFKWANDSLVREHSYQSDLIDFDSHKKWFKSKINNPNCFMFIFENESDEKIGQVRIDKLDETNSLISISVAKEHRGKSYAAKLILISSDYFLNKYKNICINAYIKMSNLKSKYIFEKAGFKFSKKIIYQKFESFHYKK